MEKLLLGCIFLTAFQAQAQVDPSSALILSPSVRTAPGEGISSDSSRYKTRPKAGGEQQVRGRRDETRRLPNEERNKIAVDVSPATDEGHNTYTGGAVPEMTENGTQQEAEPATTPKPAAHVVEPSQQASPGPSLDERRANILEISLAPAFIYNDSRSTYMFRDYVTLGPGFMAAAAVWVAPSFGIQTSYTSTLSGSVSSSGDGSKTVAATHQWMQAGLRGRRFLNATRMSPALTFGIDYSEYQMRVAADADLRGRLRTTGVALVLESEWPDSERFSWLLGGTFVPKTRHRETATALDLRSGADVETNSVGISAGGRLLFDRGSSIFFRLSQSVEKNLFSGQAAIADPRSGVKPSGVTVLNSFTVFALGYTWGN